MAVTLPACVRLVAAGATLQDHVTAFHTWITANPGNFSVDNVVGSPVTSFTLTHSSGWQINYRISGGALLTLIAPSGGITNSASPGTPTNAMTEDTAFPALSGTGVRANVARYADAIFWGIQSSGFNSYPYAIMAGRCVDSLEPFDVRWVGLAHFGYLMGGATVATNNAMFTTAASQRRSKVRILEGAWSSPATIAASFGQTQAARGRFCPLVVQTTLTDATPSASTSPPVGVCAYCRIDTVAALAPLNVVPSDTTDQGMLSVNDSTSTTRFRVVWDKNVTP